MTEIKSSKEKRDLRWKQITRFDRIKLSKLLDMSQSAVQSLCMSVVGGLLIDSIFPIPDHNITNTELFFQMCAQVILNVIFIYYLRKISEIIPFLFSLDPNYIQDQHGEEINGTMFILSFMLYKCQNALQAKINIILKRLPILRLPFC